jgi:hypothetical protein
MSSTVFETTARGESATMEVQLRCSICKVDVHCSSVDSNLFLMDKDPILQVLSNLIGEELELNQYVWNTKMERYDVMISEASDDELSNNDERAMMMPQMSPFCGECSQVVRELADLQCILERTEKSIRKKVSWVKSQINGIVLGNKDLPARTQQSQKGHASEYIKS